MKNRTSLNDLNVIMFSTMELLLNNNDPKAEAKEKIEIEAAKCIADLAGVVVNGYKVQVQALSIISRTENPKLTESAVVEMGILSAETKAVGNG